MNIITNRMLVLLLTIVFDITNLKYNYFYNILYYLILALLLIIIVFVLFKNIF